MFELAGELSCKSGSSFTPNFRGLKSWERATLCPCIRQACTTYSQHEVVIIHRQAAQSHMWTFTIPSQQKAVKYLIYTQDEVTPPRLAHCDPGTMPAGIAMQAGLLGAAGSVCCGFGWRCNLQGTQHAASGHILGVQGEEDGGAGGGLDFGEHGAKCTDPNWSFRGLQRWRACKPAAKMLRICRREMFLPRLSLLSCLASEAYRQGGIASSVKSRLFGGTSLEHTWHHRMSDFT